MSVKSHYIKALNILLEGENSTFKPAMIENFCYSSIRVTKVRNRNSFNIAISLDCVDIEVSIVKLLLEHAGSMAGIDINEMMIIL